MDKIFVIGYYDSYNKESFNANEEGFFTDKKQATKYVKELNKKDFEKPYFVIELKKNKG